MLLTIKAKPNSKISAVDGYVLHKDKKVLRVFLKSAPVDGKANKELIDVLSKAVLMPKASISIISGLGARLKVVEIYCDKAQEEQILLHLQACDNELFK